MPFERMENGAAKARGVWKVGKAGRRTGFGGGECRRTERDPARCLVMQSEGHCVNPVPPDWSSRETRCAIFACVSSEGARTGSDWAGGLEYIP